VNADKALVALSAYNNATDRLNVFNQTDLTYGMATGRFRHTLLVGAEIGRQRTDNFRNTGYFDDVATSILVPYASPTITTPVTFRQSATDADNHLRTNVAATYAQDQVELSRHVQVLAGLRFDRFDLKYHNNRNSDTLDRVDDLLSPRAGLIYKPIEPVSVYGSYSVSYLPSSGDQFSSLTTVTQQVKPEKFSNYEFGAKWDIDRYLSLTTAVFRLDRTNTRATDPNDPTRIIQTGSQRTNGFEVGANGSITRSWRIAGGYAYQDAFITSATTAARLGAQVGQVPHHTLSLWNNYQVFRKLGLGLGILNRSDMWAAIDNTVSLPGYTRADGAVFYFINEKVRLQANVLVPDHPHQRRQERQLPVREAGEVSGGEDPRARLVEVVVVDAPPEVQRDGGVLDELEELERDPRLEHLQQIGGDPRAPARHACISSTNPRRLLMRWSICREATTSAWRSNRSRSEITRSHSRTSCSRICSRAMPSR
jgi:catecholate siderophore receptor